MYHLIKMKEIDNLKIKVRISCAATLSPNRHVAALPPCTHRMNTRKKYCSETTKTLESGCGHLMSRLSTKSKLE